MDEIFNQIVIKLRGMWEFRWLGLLTAWGVAIFGVVAIFFIPDRYEASARIFVNTASILKPLMTGLTVLPNDEQQIGMLSRMVISRPNVEKLVQLSGLDAASKSKDQFDKLVDDVTKVLSIKSAGRDNLYTLAYRDVDPARAKRIVELFSSMFIESGTDRKASDTDAAKKFIDEQIVIYEKKLQEAEGRLKDFKLRSMGAGAAEGGGHFARMTEMSNLLEKAQLELREAENTRDAFRRGLTSEETPSVGASTSVSSGALVDIEGRLDAMRRNLDGLLQRYTDVHPDVVGAKRVIRELEAQRQQILSSKPRDGGANALGPSYGGPRASEQLKVSLASAEAAVASLRARVAEYANRYAKLKASATLVPQLEAEFAQLNRDYDINKKNYETLVSKRETAIISGEMQSVSGVADFRLIDPPRVSPKPVTPNRQLLIPLAMLAAIAAGFGAAFLARETRPAFFETKSLAEATGLPILGSVSFVASEAASADSKRSVLRFFAGVGALLSTYAIGLVALFIFSARTA